MTPSKRQLWILARVNPTVELGITCRADALWSYLVTYHRHGFRKPAEAFLPGEPVNCYSPTVLTCWIWNHIDEHWKPPTAAACLSINIDWLRDRGWADPIIWRNTIPKERKRIERQQPLLPLD